MKKRNLIKTFGVSLFCLFLSTGSVLANHDTPPETALTQTYINTLYDVFENIRQSYVGSVSDKKLLEAAIKGMVKTLDKHSSYWSKEQYAAMKQDLMNDTFSGIGSVIMKDKKSGFVLVVKPVDGSPAMKAGLKTGDLIISVNKKNVKKLTIQDAANLIRGPKGSKVILRIKREKEFLTIPVVRDNVEKQIAEGRVIKGNIGYVHVDEFNYHISTHIRKILVKLQKTAHLKGVILDLRSNPGGLLIEAVRVTNLFVDHGDIVSTKGRDAVHHHTLEVATKGTVIPLNMPMVVLVNQFSASASEIVTGSLQDLKRATVVGVQSYGKGSVQTIMPLENGGALRLTTAKYYTSSGRSIDGKGITPDVVIEMPKSYEPKSPYDIDPQLEKAIEVLKSKER